MVKNWICQYNLRVELLFGLDFVHAVAQNLFVYDAEEEFWVK